MALTAKMMYSLFTCTVPGMLSDLLIESRMKPSLFWLKRNLPDKVSQGKLGVKTHVDSAWVCVSAAVFGEFEFIYVHIRVGEFCFVCVEQPVLCLQLSVSH